MAPKLGFRDTDKPTNSNVPIGLLIERARGAWRYLGHNIDGATAIEYGLLAGLVAVGLAGGLGALADLVNLLFDSISEDTTDVANSMTTP